MNHIEKFWSKVNIKGPNECWEWTTGCFSNGYGCFWNGSSILAHRFAYEDRIGPIPKGKLVCHKCDNLKCCNPCHLFLGTHRDNSHDASRKGRLPGGGCTYSEDQIKMVTDVRRLIKSGLSQAKVARMFGVDQSSMSRIVNRQTYIHVA